MAMGVWFQEITGNVDGRPEGHSTMTSLFSKNFHQCNLNKECKFVLENLQTNEYRAIASENDLPQNRDGYRIWKKKEEKGKAIQRILGVKIHVSHKKRMIRNSTLWDIFDKIPYKISKK